jgi:hypothetical protein
MTYLIDIEESEESLKKTERIEATCIEDAELIIKGQFPSWHIVNIKENNVFDDNGYSKTDDHNPYPEE